MGVFTRAEMDRRLQALRHRMDSLHVDAVLATSYAGSYYLSGAPIHAFGRPMATVVPREGAPAIVESIIEIDHTRRQSWIEDVRTYHDTGIGAADADPVPPLRSMVRLARDVLADRGIAAGRLGIEDAHLSLEMHQHLLAALPDATFVGVSGALHGLRSVLSPEELQLIRQADAIADLGQERLIAEVQPGRSTSDVTAIVRHAMIDAIARRHPEMPYHLHVGGGLGRGELSAGHSEWTTWAPHDLYVQGQLLETVVSVWLWGYWGNVERAIYLGDPPDDVRRCFAVMIEANEVAIAAIRPGVRLAEIDRLAKSVLARHGFTTRSGSGCGRGIVSYEANARELAMDVRLYSDVVLEPGMAFSLEPDLHVPGLGTFRHCNTIIVTAQGCEVDSRLPRGLIAI